MTTATLTIEGDAEEVLALAARWGLKPYQNQTEVIPESAPNHTNGEVVPGVDLDHLPPLETRPAWLGADVEKAKPEPDRSKWGPRQGPDGDPVRQEPAKPKPSTKDADGLTPGHLQALGALKVVWLTTAELAQLMGRRPQGLGNQLVQLASRGLCERSDRDLDGKTRYRIGPPPWEQQAAPAQDDAPPAPLLELPPRAPYLQMRDLTGHALTVVTALWQHGTIGLARLMELTLLDEETCRGVVRMCIKQGYATRVEPDDGDPFEPVRYALTDAVVRPGGAADG